MPAEFILEKNIFQVRPLPPQQVAIPRVGSRVVLPDLREFGHMRC